MVEIRFFASVMARADEVRTSEDSVRRELEDAGLLNGSGRSANAEGLRVACALTGGTEAMILEWLRGSANVDAAEDPPPVVLLALPHSNSLPACLEVLACLQRRQAGGRVIVAGRGPWLGELRTTAIVARATRYLATARIGLIGGPSSWLAASSPDPAVIQAEWGPRVEVIPLGEVVARCRALETDPGSRSRLEDMLDAFRRRLSDTVEPSEEALRRAVAIEAALRDLAAEASLQALTIRCFDLLEPLANTGCVAVARLNDSGLVAGCEGDLPALLTMMLLTALTGGPSFMANPCDVDLQRGTVTFAHCTVPLGLVERVRARTHFESGLGVGLEGHFAPEVMTIARVGDEKLDRLEVFRGRPVVPSPETREDLCRTQITLSLEDSALHYLLTRPLGNHHVMVPGDHVDALARFQADFSAAASRRRLKPFRAWLEKGTRPADGA